MIRWCQITDAASTSSRPSATCSFEIERSITFALLELFPSYSHGASEQLSMPLCRQRGNGGMFTSCQEVYRFYFSRKFGKFLPKSQVQCDFEVSCAFAKYAAVSLPTAAPPWVHLGISGPVCCSPGCLLVCRRRLAHIAAALAASLSVGAVWPAFLQPWLPRCLSVPFGPHCCSPGCLVVCWRRMALVAAALAASLKCSLGTPCRGRASAGRALAEILELRRCLRSLASLPLGAVVSLG